MPSLLTMPKELQLQIVEYLGLKAGLKNLCLVCKEMRDVATPMLYEDMTVSVKKLNSNFRELIATTKDHRGLPHIRTLVVVDLGREERLHSAAYEILVKLLSALPRDLLTNFQLPTYSVLDLDLDRLVRDRQRKLPSYQYQSPECRYGPGTSLLPSGDGFSCVTTLNLCIQGVDDCRQAGSILMHSPRVTSLAIVLSRKSVMYSEGDLILEIICGMAHKCRGPLLPTALRFENIPLAGVESPLQDYLALEALQHLQLLRCVDVDSFLKGLSQKCSGLQSFALDCCEDARSNDTISNFLRATTLRRLVLRGEPSMHNSEQGLVAFDTLASSARTIQCLVLDDSTPRLSISGPERRAGSSTDFEGLCRSFQNLQQLCVMSPVIDRKQWVSGGFPEFLGHLQHLHKLRVLKLVFHELGYYYPDLAYHEAADTVFDILGPSCPELTALVLRSRCRLGTSAWCFVRSKEIGGRAQARFLGKNVAPYVIKDYEPCSDMLEPEKLIFG